MVDSREWDDLFDDTPIDKIEMMVRAAGDYVCASDELRPQVLETARTQRSEKRAQRRIQRAAIVLILLAMFTPPPVEPLGTATRGHSTLAAIDSETLFFQAQTRASRGGDDFAWGMVEAFTELRRHQAELLGTAL